ncbi:DUF6415 family natural product biosynthesis protein [Streptomyces sp. NPDC090052]|uniref:DUF6415 family natural product biosynthesis protein n=1 Tax=unclassified Streptomyces TaxID=2593676 RepID=UPI003254D218
MNVTPQPGHQRQQSSETAPLDTALMADTVKRALRALDCVPVPRPDTVQTLTSLLKGHIALLLSELRPVLDTMDRGSLEWGRAKVQYNNARALLDSDQTRGLSSAVARLADLARTCNNLMNDHFTVTD